LAKLYLPLGTTAQPLGLAEGDGAGRMDGASESDGVVNGTRDGAEDFVGMMEVVNDREGSSVGPGLFPLL